MQFRFYSLQIFIELIKVDKNLNHLNLQICIVPLKSFEEFSECQGELIFTKHVHLLFIQLL